VFSSKGSNLSHNHRLSSQLTFVDGRAIVNMEYSLTPEEIHSITDQSCCCVQVPQMRVNLEEYFPDCSFTSPMLYWTRDKFLKDGHQDLFVKGKRIQSLGGSFLVVPLSIDFRIKIIHCQTKLMGEYPRVFGKNSFKMAYGTHMITKYDMTFVFWMVVDRLLRSKFVSYTANFSENSGVILNGADVFSNMKVPSQLWMLMPIKSSWGGSLVILIPLLTIRLTLMPIQNLHPSSC
jgi:hypothetical protein